MTRAWLGLLGLVAWAGPLWGEPLDRQAIPASARWVVHFDVDAARDAPAVGSLLAGAVQSDAARKNIDRMAQTVGIDPTKDLHGLTFAGREFRPPDGVVTVHAKLDAERLVGLARSRPEYRLEEHRDRSVHLWTENSGKPDRYEAAGCIVGPSLVVFGRDRRQVCEALDVLDGQAQGAAGQGSPLAAEPPPGTVLSVRAIDPDQADIPFVSPLIRKSRFLAIDVGEREGTAFLRARLEVRSDEAAAQVRDVLQGLVAMSQLEMAEHPKAVEQLKRIRVTLDGQTVRVEWDVPSADLAALAVDLKSKPKPARP